ncbi:S-layer homology domain-containing protein [Lysinibacillus yapensis]|nr:S-layer homology domain-containing protein [Lysinibacillus yapensis]
MKRHLLKMLCWGLIFLIAIHGPAIASANTKLYEDVSPNHWAYSSISVMKEKNIMDEDSKGMFVPNRSVTRAEVVSHIYLALNQRKIGQSNFSFEDVPKNAPYQEALSALTELGVIDRANKFYPDKNVTRAELSKMISIAFNIVVDQKNAAKFRDVSSKHWAKDYIESMADTNLINGTAKNIFQPNNRVTRAQIAVILYRTLQFKDQLASYKIIYDYLKKDYVSTINGFPKWTNKAIELVNAERKKQGLSALKTDQQLTQLAVVKASDMIEHHYFEHYSPNYGNAWDLAGVFDYSFTTIGENIARNYKSPETVVEAWLKSPSHKKNIMNQNYTNIGIACMKSDNGEYYWVQLFSSK